MRTTSRALICLGLLAAVVLLLAGCGGKSMNEAVAKLNGQPITQGEFMDALESGVGLQTGPNTGKIVLSNLLIRRLVEDDAREKGVTVTEEEVEKELVKAKERLEAESKQSFEDVLKEMGTTVERAREDLRFNILLQKLVVTESEIEEFYNQRPEDFDTPEMVTYYQMFLKTEDDAKAARQEVLEGKRSFAEVAKEKSLKPGPDSYPWPPGGIPVTVPAGPISHVIEGFGDLLASMQPGEITEPLKIESDIPTRRGPKKTDTAWVLVYLESRQPAVKATFESAHDEALRRVFSRKIAYGAVRQYFDSLKAKARLEIVDPAYSALGEEFQSLAKDMPTFTPPEMPAPGEGGMAPVPTPSEAQPAPQ